MRQKSAGRIEIIKKGRDTILKFNPYHGYHGYFSSRDAHSSFSPGSNAANAARAIARENKRRIAEGNTDLTVNGAYTVTLHGKKATYAEARRAAKRGLSMDKLSKEDQVNEMKRRDEKVETMQNRINEHAKKMAEVDQAFRGSYSHEHPSGDRRIREKYLSMKSQADQFRDALNEAQNSAREAHKFMEEHYPKEYGKQQHHTFVNGWGEATHRQIESPTWKRWQRKNDEEIKNRLRLWDL